MNSEDHETTPFWQGIQAECDRIKWDRMSEGPLHQTDASWEDLSIHPTPGKPDPPITVTRTYTLVPGNDPEGGRHLRDPHPPEDDTVPYKEFCKIHDEVMNLRLEARTLRERRDKIAEDRDRYARLAGERFNQVVRLEAELTSRDARIGQLEKLLRLTSENRDSYKRDGDRKDAKIEALKVELAELKQLLTWTTESRDGYRRIADIKSAEVDRLLGEVANKTWWLQEAKVLRGLIRLVSDNAPMPDRPDLKGANNTWRIRNDTGATGPQPKYVSEEQFDVINRAFVDVVNP